MEIKNMSKTKTRCPEITVIADPNGSGKLLVCERGIKKVVILK